jgi:hypothetical protein
MIVLTVKFNEKGEIIGGNNLYLGSIRQYSNNMYFLKVEIPSTFNVTLSANIERPDGAVATFSIPWDGTKYQIPLNNWVTDLSGEIKITIRGTATNLVQIYGMTTVFCEYAVKPTNYTPSSTTGELDSLLTLINAKAEKTRTINGYPLTSNIVLELSDLNDDVGYSTDAEVDSKLLGYVPTSRTINSKVLSSNVTLTTNDLENNSGFITSSALTPYALANSIPTQVSQLTNNSNFQTATQLANVFKDATLEFNSANGFLTLSFTKYNNDTVTLDAINLPTELIVTSGSYDSVTNEIVLVLANNTEIRFSAGGLLNEYTGDNTSIELYTDTQDGNKLKFRIKGQWITDNIDTKLAKTGNGKDVTIEFGVPETYTAIQNNDTLATIVGKVTKRLGQLQSFAFKDSILTSDLPTGTVVDASYVHTDNNLTNQLVTDINGNTTARHTHSNKSVLDGIVGQRTSIETTEDYDTYIATIGAIKEFYNNPDADWDGDADTLDGFDASISNVASTVVVRDADGFINVGYDNSESGLVSTDLKSAIDELQFRKIDVGTLSSNINLFPTNASASVEGYFKMVDSLSDASYNTTAVNIPTGAIETQNQLLASLISPAGLIIGNPGIVSIFTVGNIRKTSGNSNQFASFYFEVYQRTSGGTETLIATSDTTPPVNPTTLNVYSEFSANALLNNGTFLITDTIVIKYYANSLGSSNGATYDFQFGGTSPTRTLIPVPVNVIPSDVASDIFVSTTNFNGILTTSDDTVQKALDKIDDHNHSGVYQPVGSYLTTETDPTVPSHVKEITTTKISNWDSAFSWGNHASAGYLTSIPDIAITDTFVVGSESAMLGLTAQKGDIAVRTDEAKTYILQTEPATTLANWVHLPNPTSGGSVTSVDATVPTGLSVSGVPIATSGTIAITYASGYAIPTTEKQGQWDSAFSWGNHASAGYLTTFTETDPTVASHVKNITSTQITNWDSAFGWGNHSTAGYLTTESDPVFTGSVAYGIDSTDVSNWDTAYGWGDHATENYTKQTHYTSTLPFASWTDTSGGAPYTKTVTISGITSSDIPVLDINFDGVSYANVEDIQTSWGKVYRATTNTNEITFYATEVPTIDVPFIAKVVK